MTDGRRLGCQAKVMGDVVIDVPPEIQVHKQVIRKSATRRDIVMDPATRLLYVEVAEPDMHEPTGDFERLARALQDQWQLSRMSRPTCRAAPPAARLAQGRVEGHRRPAPGQPRRAHRILDIWPAFMRAGSTGWPSTLGPPPSPPICAILPTARCWPRPA